MPTGDYLTITDFTTNEQPQNANDVLFCLDKKIKSTSDYVHWWFELSDEDAYKSNPNLSIDLHRADNPRFAYPGNIGVAVLFFTDVVDNDLFLQEYKQTYLEGYISGWNKCQAYSDRSVRVGTQPIQERKTAVFNQFIEYRAKYSGRGFQAAVLRQMGYDAGFMFALAQEIREIDAIIPRRYELSQKGLTPNLNDFIIRDRENVLRFIKAELGSCRRPQGKLIAEFIIVLRDSGYFVQTQGKLTQIHKAFCNMFPGKVAELSGIDEYINSRDNHNYKGIKKITDDELNQLQQKLKNFVK